MRNKIITIICMVFILTGCKNASEPLDKALTLRNRLLNSNGCSFQTEITADYGDKGYTFTMDCTCDQEGNLIFTVSKPETIAGISGKISSDGGSLTFDDKVLAFKTIADGQISPVTAPWVFIKTLRSGYLNGCTSEKDGYQIMVDDSYEENAFRLNIYVKNDLPTGGEIFWEGRRILILTVNNFIYL